MTTNGTRRLAALVLLTAGVVLAGGCAKEDVSGHLECVVHASPVTCDADACVAPDGEPADGLAAAASAVVISREASRFAPDGVYVYAELPAPAGALGVLELDVAPGGPTPSVTYDEWSGAEQVFHAVRTTGTVAVGRGGDRRGRFLLRVDDAGPDGVLDTADDQVRVLAAGVFGPPATAAPPALSGAAPVGSDGDAPGVLDVVDLVLDVASAAGDGTATDDDSGGSGCGGEDVADADPGCGADGAGDGGGCDSGGDVGSSGCDSGGDMGGCEGDVGGGGCEPDARGAKPATGAAGARSQPHARGPQRLAPLLVVGAVAVRSRGRRRRGAGHRAA